nr:hypothetical protein BaRGS_022225 [Batillaria attramentaria]
MLLRMDELELVQLLNVTDRVQQNAMQTAIRAIREHGVKMPETLTLFFLLSLEHFPRCTIVLSNLFYYDEVFLPLLHSTTPVEWGDRPEADWGKLPRPKTSQWILFYLWTVMLPNWKLALFAWSFRWEHYVVLVPVLLHFLVGTFLDIHVTIELFLRRNLKRQSLEDGPLIILGARTQTRDEVFDGRHGSRQQSEDNVAEDGGG